MKKFFIFLASILLIFISFFFFNRILAQDEEGPVCPSCPPFSCPGRAWTEYRCTSNCDGEIETRSCSYSCWCSETDECGCCSDCDCGSTTSTNWTPEGTKGHPWQKCIDDGDLETKPYFACRGECLKAPENPRYYDNPNYSDQPDKDLGPSGEKIADPERQNKGLFLPVKLDWDNVEGWGQPDGPQSYLIRIEDTAKDSYSKTLNISEYNYRNDPNAGSCFLKPNTTHNWSVKACCSPDGKNCGSESNWPLQTNLSPEPISPADPDWSGQEKIENLPFPINFDWCNITKATGYYLQVYLEDKEIIGWVVESPQASLDFPDLNKDTEYKWRIASCFDQYGSCTDLEDYNEKNFSQFWNLKTISEVPLTPPELLSPSIPEGIPVVGIPAVVAWENLKRKGVNSYYYQLSLEKNFREGSILKEGCETASEKKFDSLDLNITYYFRVKSCFDETCQDCKEYSQPYSFKTTGETPNLIDPSPENGASVYIPVTFYWNIVDGAQSYKQELSLESNFSSLIELLDKRIIKPIVVPPIKAILTYQELDMEKTYYWRVRACADSEGTICGDPATRSFTTLLISPPELLSPEDGSDETLPVILKWKQVNEAWYEYTLLSEGKEIKKEITSDSNAYFSELEPNKEYQWGVRSCIDPEGKKCGEWSWEVTEPPFTGKQWKFTIIQPTPPTWGGIVPCGRNYDDPTTLYNEMEKCEFKHVFLLIKNILDFVLWKLAPIILVLLVVATGVIFYFSIGAPTILAQVKSIWKSAGIGYLFIFLSWTIINIILKFLGYTVKWWIITF